MSPRRRTRTPSVAPPARVDRFAFAADQSRLSGASQTLDDLLPIRQRSRECTEPGRPLAAEGSRRAASPPTRRALGAPASAHHRGSSPSPLRAGAGSGGSHARQEAGKAYRQRPAAAPAVSPTVQPRKFVPAMKKYVSAGSSSPSGSSWMNEIPTASAPTRPARVRLRDATVEPRNRLPLRGRAPLPPIARRSNAMSIYQVWATFSERSSGRVQQCSERVPAAGFQPPGRGAREARPARSNRPQPLHRTRTGNLQPSRGGHRAQSPLTWGACASSVRPRRVAAEAERRAYSA